jgi:hypothetical protein
MSKQGQNEMTRWQKSVTQKAIRNNRVRSFDCGFIAKLEDMAGRLEPFRPCWSVQYLGDGTNELFNEIKDAQEWIRSFGDI